LDAVAGPWEHRQTRLHLFVRQNVLTVPIADLRVVFPD